MFCLYLIAAVILPSVLADDCPCWDMNEEELTQHCELWVSGSNPDQCSELALVEYDSCVCCRRCTRDVNEVCGGENGVLGVCSPGLKCSFITGNSVFGLCTEDTDEDAILAQNFSPPMFLNKAGDDNDNGLGHIFW
ncbi:venom protein 302-like [Anneissia japonica]|uniref:venom protein 302-like n=1 Tax=Anneissia japonica TaxID=1529436 RepID=UPI0014258A79|nr:venom protein 302-like [Anneissia japonica]